MVMRHAVVRGLGINFDHPGYVKVHPMRGTRVFLCFPISKCGRAAAGIRSRPLGFRSATPKLLYATTADWLNDATSTRKLLANVQRKAKVCTRKADKSSSTSEAKRQKAKDELEREQAQLAHLF